MYGTFHYDSDYMWSLFNSLTKLHIWQEISPVFLGYTLYPGYNAKLNQYCWQYALIVAGY